jgi:alpha-beta hydrolase superfamily lysophospholipase
MNVRSTNDSVSATPVPPDYRLRALILLSGAALLQLLFFVLPHLAPGIALYAYSERLHATVLGVWLLDFVLYGRKLHTWRSGYRLPLIVGIILLLAFAMWNGLLMQAAASDARARFPEVLYKMALIGSLFILYRVFTVVSLALLNAIPPIRKLLVSPRGRFVSPLLAVVRCCLFFPYLFSCNNIHRFKVQDGTNPMIAYKLPYEVVRFPAATDGLPLDGWFIPAAKDNKRAVIVCHGVGANKGIFLGVAPFLHSAGFNVLFFDFRGHGSSAGHTVTYGNEEARDVKGAVAYLKQRGMQRIALYGFSMGGAATLLAAPDLPAVDSVVVDSTFADFRPLVRQQLGWTAPFDGLATIATDICSRIEVGAPLDVIKPSARIASISPRPLFIIHGKADALIPYSQAETNFAAAKEPKQLWLVPGANHCLCRLVSPEVYEIRVTRFLQQSLR